MIKRFLKKAVEGFMKKEPEKKHETLEFSRINEWLESKEKEIESEKEKLAQSIKDEMNAFINSLNENMSVLEHFDIEKFSDNHRTKHIVSLNLKEYMKLVERLLGELEGYGSLGFAELDRLINTSFQDFNKRAYPRYQKATYLIGKELYDVNQCIQSFLKTYSKLVDNNKDIIIKSNLLIALKEKLSESDENWKEKKNIDSSIKELKQDIREWNQDIKKHSLEIEKIENSKEYIENLQRTSKEKEMHTELNKEIIRLKQSIDFKSLTKIFHSSEEYMPIVKDFKENFEKSFKANENLLIEMLDESKLNTDNIKNQIKSIHKTLKSIEDIKPQEDNNRLDILKDGISKLEQRINSALEDIAKKTKRIDKIEESDELIKDSIRQDLSKMDIILKK